MQDSPLTNDALVGPYKILQRRKGHRYSTDDLLVGWYARCHVRSPKRALDLGSGVGTVATILAWNFPDTSIVTVEAQPESLSLARQSIESNRLTSRVDLRLGDLRDPTVFAADERFDLITSSPPYFDVTSGVLPRDPQKLACRFETRGSIVDYCKTAAERLTEGGRFFTVFPLYPDFQCQKLLRAIAESGLHLLRHRPVALCEGERPLLGIFEMGLAAAALGSVVEPVLTIRRQDGTISAEYTAAKKQIGFFDSI